MDTGTPSSDNMPYQVFLPCPPLQPYIDVYWLLSGFRTQQETITLIPKGDITLLLNLGEAIRSKNYGPAVSHGGMYLVGTMLRSDEQFLQGESRLLGIQFKPGAFTHFYRYEPMNRLTNQVQEFPRQLFPDIKKTIRYFVPYLDRFFLDRLSPPRHPLQSLVTDIERHGGQIKAAALARKYFITPRQLERQFNEQIGISPKEFINLTRFRFAFEKIQQLQTSRRLSDIAWECGYYDHAHLSNDFKRYTGTTPTGLILSDFSKTVAAPPR